MQRWKLSWPLLTALVLGASPAPAAVLQLEGSTLSFQIGGRELVFPQTSPSIPILVSDSGSFSLPAGVFSGSVSIVRNEFSLLTTFIATGSNATGTFSAGGGSGGGFGGVMPLAGTAIFRSLGGVVDLLIPLSIVGGGGTETRTVASLRLTVTGGIWTTGTTTVTGITTIVKTGPGDLDLVAVVSPTAAGSDARTPSHRGSLTLVTPIRVINNAGVSGPSFAVQRLVFVPEPKGLWLLLAALVLVPLGLRRRRG